MVLAWEIRKSLKLNDKKTTHRQMWDTFAPNKGHRKIAVLNGFIGKQKEMKTHEIRNKKRKRQ